ncbi:MAG: shufflon system plasmid conjugative transfer pilus tip adhesin PilV [Pseudomonadota bacterium]|nr:shufflon system plasmid conjugative transfer pilus tip adhesin PilV [Pseudomonadota bacterium]
METLMYSAIAASATVIGASAIMDSVDNTRNQFAATHFQIIQEATERYIRDNFDQLEKDAGGFGTVFLTIDQHLRPVTGTRYLQSNINSRNPYDQAYVISVRRPSPEILEALILTTGGEAIATGHTPMIAALIGPGGGAVDYMDTAWVQGSYGGWRVRLGDFVLASPGPGHIAGLIRLDKGRLVSDFIYRYQMPGIPEANTMNTDIDMNAQDIVRPDRVQVDNTVEADYGEVAAVTVEALTVTGDLVATDTDIADRVTVGGEVLDKEVAETLLRLANSCERGAVLTRQSGEITCLEELPKNMVVPVHNDSCPEGWSEYEPARGRIVRGRATGGMLGEIGGSEVTSFDIEHMPDATMFYWAGARRDGTPAWSSVAGPIGSCRQCHSYKAPSRKWGLKGAVASVPPFYALLYCINDGGEGSAAPVVKEDNHAPQWVTTSLPTARMRSIDRAIHYSAQVALGLMTEEEAEELLEHYYHVDLDAPDPDGDDVDFELIAGEIPDEIIVFGGALTGPVNSYYDPALETNAENGVFTYSPVFYDFTLRASDKYGAYSDQDFRMVLVANRPPVWLRSWQADYDMGMEVGSSMTLDMRNYVLEYDQDDYTIDLVAGSVKSPAIGNLEINGNNVKVTALAEGRYAFKLVATDIFHEPSKPSPEFEFTFKIPVLWKDLQCADYGFDTRHISAAWKHECDPNKNEVCPCPLVGADAKLDGHQLPEGKIGACRQGAAGAEMHLFKSVKILRALKGDLSLPSSECTPPTDPVRATNISFVVGRGGHDD